MKKIIVTGGSGFIGSNLVKFLLKKNYFVINIDNLSYSANPYNLKGIEKNKRYKLIKQDINNKKKIFLILNKYKPEGIFNLAAETHVDRSIDSPYSFIHSNILGTYNFTIQIMSPVMNSSYSLLPLQVVLLTPVMKIFLQNTSIC